MKNVKDVQKEYSSLPFSVAEYVIDGKRFKVVRHFSASGDVKKIVSDAAVKLAKRQAGITE